MRKLIKMDEVRVFLNDMAKLWMGSVVILMLFSLGMIFVTPIGYFIEEGITIGSIIWCIYIYGGGILLLEKTN